jgi:hypothetical protein
VATNRISQIAQKVINPSETAFLPGQNIMEGVIVLHEMHRKKRDGLILKIDFEKTYDKINWSFVQQTLRMKDFSPKWCQWVASFMEGGHVGTKFNDQVRKKIQTKKGVRQGDPLSLILFNIVVDILVVLIKKAKTEGQIEGVIPHLVDDGLSILQYAYDMILFMQHGLEKGKEYETTSKCFLRIVGV